MSIHERIRALRQAKGLSQTALAKAVSALHPEEPPITRQTIQHWERPGGTAPKRTRLEHVATVLETSVEALLFEPRLAGAAAPAPTGLMAAEPTPAPWLGLPQAVELVVQAIAALTPSAWAMARGALDTVVGHPEMRDDVASNVLLVLRAAHSKRPAAA